MKIKIEHIAYWVQDLEVIKEFYIRHFKAQPNEKYHNQKKGFRSYFLTLGEGARIEIMHMDGLIPASKKGHSYGLAHIALSLGSKEKVDELTHEMVIAGVTLIGKPRTTGDGYYESVVADPEGNLIELTE